MAGSLAKTDTTFFTSEKYRTSNERPDTIFFTSEENRMTNKNHSNV